MKNLMMKNLKLLYTHLQGFGTILEVFPLNCKSALKIHAKRSEQHQTPIKTNLHLLNIYRHSTHTKLRHPAHSCVGLRRRNSRNKKWNSSARQNRLAVVSNSRKLPIKDDPSDNQGNFNRSFKNSFIFTFLTHPDAK